YKHNLKQFFPYISDLSFLAKINNIDYIKDNLVGFNEIYFLDFEKINYISMDVFDIGTLGNDAHKFTERLDSFYTFNILPNVVFSFINKIFEN
ncbi:MAG: peptidase M20, partial [bacterium]